MSDESSTLDVLKDMEQQYSVNTAEITVKIGQLQNFAKADRPAAVGEIRSLLKEVDQLLDHMHMLGLQLDTSGPNREKYSVRVKSYRNDMKALCNELDKANHRLSGGKDRDSLFDHEDGLNRQHDQLINSTEVLERTGRKVTDAYRVAIETEQIGAGVLEDLGRQRETISRARERLRDGDADIARSSHIATNMLHRIIQNRLILLIISVVLMFMLLILVYVIL